MEKEEIERQKDYLKDLDILDFLPEEYQEGTDHEEEESQNKVEVEDIQVGQ